MSDPIIVVGGGLAAGTLVSELREAGYDGDLVVYAAEPHPPYERPPLSKDHLLDGKALTETYVHPEDWYAAHRVELHTGTPVTAVDLGTQEVTVQGEQRRYSALVLATGSKVRPFPMADDSGAEVHYLRTWEDSEALAQALVPGSRLGIVGGGWIGLEVAAAARKHDVEVTVLEALELPLVRVLGTQVAQIFTDLHRDHGVDVRTGTTIDAIRSDGDEVVVTAGGEDLRFHRLVVGVGVTADTELAEAAGLDVDNGIVVDDHLRTSDPHVYAIGDVANADHATLGRRVRVEHWDVAKKHAAVAAANLAGGDRRLEALPYFFTDQYDLGMEYVGHADDFDSVEIEGDVPSTFRAYWTKDGKVVAGMHVNDWDAIDEVRARVEADAGS